MKSSPHLRLWLALTSSVLLFCSFTAGQDAGNENVLPAFYRHSFMFTVKKGINRNIVSTYFNVQFAQFTKAFPDSIQGYFISSALEMNWFKAPDYDVGGWIDFPSVQAMQQYFQWRKTNPYSFYTRNYITNIAQLQVAVGNDYAVDRLDQYRWMAHFAALPDVDPADIKGSLENILRGQVDALGYPAYLGNVNYLGTDIQISNLLYKGINYNVALIMDFSSLYNMQNFTQMFVNHWAINDLKGQIRAAASFHAKLAG